MTAFSSLVELQEALAAHPPGRRADVLAEHLAAQSGGAQRYAWHLAEMLIVSEPELLRAAATRLRRHAASRNAALVALARLHNRLEEFDALRTLIMESLENPPLPRADWLRALARLELLAPSADAARLWETILAEQPTPARHLLSALRRIAGGVTYDLAPLRAEVARHVAALDNALPPTLRRLSQARDVAVVGNGSGLVGGNAGLAIERHDIVIRLNFPVLSGHEADTGRRTDLMLFHDTKRPVLQELRAREPEFPALPAFGVRGMPVKPPTVDPPRMPAGLEQLVSQLSYPTPSTGLFAIVLVALVFGRPVTLFGFDFFTPGRPGHYFGPTTAAVLHEMAFERWFGLQALPLLCPDLLYCHGAN